MEDIYASQTEIVQSINKLAINLKKDGPDRKTADYFKRKIDILESYWKEYQYNHDRLTTEGSRLHPYFTMTEYDKTAKLYKETIFLIRQQQQNVLETSKAAHSQAEVAPDERPSDTKTSIHTKLDELLRKQNSNFRAFKRTVANIENRLYSITQEWEINDSLRTLQMRWSNVDSLHWEIDQELLGSNDEYEESFSECEEMYEHLKHLLNNKLSNASYREKSTPKMDIPTFNGNFQQWVPFKNLFTEAIHNNPCLTNLQKMQYLKSKVRGEAEHLIQNLLISSDNYTACWDILNHRYDHPRLIFSSYVNLILNLPVTQQSSLSHLKRIHDTTFESLNAIKNLGVDTSSWDPLIVQILLQKLDSDIQNQFLESLKQPRELFKLKEFLEYLEKKFTCGTEIRKKQEYPKTNINPSTSRQFKPNNFYTKPFLTKTSQPNFSNKTTVYNCPYCNSNHWLNVCDSFSNLTSQQKRSFVTKNNLCQNCLFSHGGKACISNKRCHECQGKHHTILHDAFRGSAPHVEEPSTSRPAVLVTGQHSDENRNGYMSPQHNIESEILLATAVIKVRANNGNYYNMRALIDQGSQTSLISEKAAQLLALPRQKCKGMISGIGTKISQCRGVINVTCASLHTDYVFTTDMLIMNTLIKNLPSITFNKPTWSHLENIALADSEFHISRPVDILLGADIYSNIIMNGISRSDESLPVAQQTRLGWILCGNVKTLYCNVILHQEQMDDIHKFWEVEDIAEEPSQSSEDLYCLEYYKTSTSRRANGTYEVRYPFKPGFQEKIGLSKNMASAQFRSIERKFYNNPTIAHQYSSFINEYMILGHMKPSVENKKPDCYLPHHCVLRNESTTTALRVVFNASKKTSSGLSLNDLMFKGANLQQDLQNLLIKWRQFEFAFTADIEKMYRFIWINEQDQQFQKIVWRDSPDEHLKDYQLCTVTYGTKAAPFLAMMTLKQLASDERNNFNSIVIKTLEESFYMDDVLHGAHSLENTKQLQQDLIELLKRGGFNLRKWKSNSPELLQDEANSENKEQNFEFKQENSTKTLGLRWNTSKDTFIFQSKIDILNKKHTKRSVLSDISKLFDPLGWLSPLSTKLKLLFQAIYLLNIQWDDEIPEHSLKEWISLRDSISAIDQFKLPRWIGIQPNKEVELHGFCDASSQAYACVIYCRTVTDSNIKITLVAGKTRLVPATKKISLPRLELSGALLLAKLMHKVQRCLENYNINIVCWTDSMVVLGWLNGDPGRWKTFVSNRVCEITNKVPPNCWRYVKSVENPADCASRGMTVRQLQEHSLWWQGPTWLLNNYNEDEQQTIPVINEELRRIKHVNLISKENDLSIIAYLLNKHSSYRKLIHVLAWVQRFINLTKNKIRTTQSYLSLQEIKNARYALITYVQRVEYESEIRNLQQNVSISTKSKLLELNPFIDSNNILRVGGRLRNATIDPEMKHPIILPHSGPLTNLIIDDAHKLTFHGGPRTTLANIRQKYWIVGGNRAVKKRLRMCIKCRRHNPSIPSPLMGDLPVSRCNSFPPFYHTGVDFTGHVMIKHNKGRGVKTTKGYVAVFICMATRLIHLELVSDLSSSAFIAALRRMSARRGTPRHIYSDNGTNFVGTNKILQEQYEHLQHIYNDEEFITEVVGMEIEWHFNAPSWPSAGGLWEAAVKSLKRHMRIVINDQKLTYEEFLTVLTQLEAILNSRPLCPLTEDPEDLDFLTPSSFINIKQDLTFIGTETDMRSRWYFTQKIVEDIWKRWRTEYLSQLSVRSKWRTAQENVKLNDVVLIKDANLPPGKWAMGRVVELHPGNDGHVRVVTLRTKNGLIKRPVTKISVMPINSGAATQDDVSQRLT